MGEAKYEIVSGKDGWSVAHDGKTTGNYATKEVAFEAAVLPASNAIKKGHKVTIIVEGSRDGEPALGAS